MNGIVRASVVLILMTGITGAQTQSSRPAISQVKGDAPDSIKKEILDIEDEHHRAIQSRDRAALNRILADNWAYTNERGEVLTKAQWIANVVDRRLTFDTVAHDDFRIDLFGDDVAALTGRSTSTLRYEGKVSRGPRRFGLVWQKRNGEWKLLAHFVALVPQD